jgi:UDP-N-acetylglucosamine 4,6-dehydratase (inverting)
MSALFENKTVLITGGTGSFGRAMASRLLLEHPEIRRIVIFSRDELKQHEMSNVEPYIRSSKMRFFLGDIRDRDRLKRALEGIDVVIHAAALKQVPAAEYNPYEFIKTNILGAQNLIEVALDHEVSQVVALSTDKAAAPLNLYGATKLVSDKLFVAANTMKGDRNLTFSVVRYGNVFGSRGSVVPTFLRQSQTGKLQITDQRMTRFNISLDDGVNMVLWALNEMDGGEIFVPKIPSYRITDLARAVCDSCEFSTSGIRPGEKLHEEMITKSDVSLTVDFGQYYAILPSYFSSQDVAKYIEKHQIKMADMVDGYSSDTNSEFLNTEQLATLVATYSEMYK